MFVETSAVMLVMTHRVHGVAPGKESGINGGGLEPTTGDVINPRRRFVSPWVAGCFFPRIPDRYPCAVFFPAKINP